MNLNVIGNFFHDLASRFGGNYFFAPPADSLVLWVYFGFFTTLLLVTLGYYIYLRIKARSMKPYRTFAKSWFWPNLTFAILGLLLTFFRYEQIAVLSWRFWIYVLLATILTFEVWFFVARRQQLADELEKEENKKRIGKWLPKAKRKK